MINKFIDEKYIARPHGYQEEEDDPFEELGAAIIWLAIKDSQRKITNTNAAIAQKQKAQKAEAIDFLTSDKYQGVRELWCDFANIHPDDLQGKVEDTVP